MRSMLVFLIIAIVPCVRPASSKLPGEIATCIGAKNCSACKNCHSCGHCAKTGETCGICSSVNAAVRLKPVPAKSIGTIQCKAITKKGTRCSRKAASGGYCWQHY